MSEPINPFNFGDLALDEGFTDREAELRELEADVRNGQNVVVFAPRRYGKTSLVWRATQELVKRDEVLVAQVDLMRTATREQLAAKLAQALYEQVATPLDRVRERAGEIFRGLRIRPVMTLDPQDGSLGFSFAAGHPREDVNATLERLLELPAELAAERGRRVALVFDEFQQVIKLDPGLPALMRAVFQSQPDVSHVYLGSKRSLMEELFNDVNEPFWRSAKHIELGPIPVDAFAVFIAERFMGTGKEAPAAVVDAVLAITWGHPYGTQELCYALWEETPLGAAATAAGLDAAMARVLRSENAYFTHVWEGASRAQRVVLQALAADPPDAATSDEYRRRHGLPAPSSVQRALDALVTDELVAREGPGRYRIAEPFLAEWIHRYGA
jgi:type II secretory pathway predicted ATPase ExeA